MGALVEIDAVPRTDGPGAVRPVAGRGRSPRAAAVAVSAAVVASTAVGGAPRALAVKPQPAGVPRTWVGAWSAAPVVGTGSGFGDQTLREVVHTTMGGDQVRIRLTNSFGTDGLVIGGATIGVRVTGATVAAGTERPVTFGGARTVVLPAGSDVLSDPVPLAAPAARTWR
ncbi:hypothetical protein GCM10029978_098100 [Actinoallomurus acanthiterrae]